MKRVPIRKLSLLGLVLVSASAVTAAILPKSDTKVTKAGGLEASSDGKFSCKINGVGAECTASTGASTGTSAGATASENGFNSTGTSQGSLETGTDVRVSREL